MLLRVPLTLIGDADDTDTAVEDDCNVGCKDKGEVGEESS